MATLCTYSSYLSTSDLLSFIICSIDKLKFRSIRKGTGCSNDLTNHVDCFIKRDFYHVENAFRVLKVSVVYQEKYMAGVITWVFA